VSKLEMMPGGVREEKAGEKVESEMYENVGSAG
jgi:hypothetical protein